MAAFLARGEGAGADCVRWDGTGAEEVAFSRAAADPSLIAPAGAPFAPAGPPEPIAARPATVPPAMTAQAPSATSTTRMGARGGLKPERAERPEPACLPLTPEPDVLTTLPIVSPASAPEASRAEALARRAYLLERLGPSVASPLRPGKGLVRDGAGAGE